MIYLILTQKSKSVKDFLNCMLTCMKIKTVLHNKWIFKFLSLIHSIVQLSVKQKIAIQVFSVSVFRWICISSYIHSIFFIWNITQSVWNLLESMCIQYLDLSYLNSLLRCHIILLLKMWLVFPRMDCHEWIKEEIMH